MNLSHGLSKEKKLLCYFVVINKGQLISCRMTFWCLQFSKKTMHKLI